MKYQLITAIDALGLRAIVKPIYYSYKRAKVKSQERRNADRVLSVFDSHAWMRERIASGRPFAAGKIGSLEAEALHIFLSSKNPKADRNWKGLGERLFANVGVFPPSAEVFARFCKVYGESLGGIDGIAVWFNKGEQESIAKWAPDAQLGEFSMLEPYLDANPWTLGLAGCRVVVVSPFRQSIERQIPRLEAVWSRHPIWPELADISVVPAPFSAALAEPQDADWFAALDRLESDLAQRQFDIALIGAGGYSLPLCTRVKKMGRSAIHTGGATQLFFGIMGGRWRGSDFESRFANEHWIDPLPAELPAKREKVEGGCYW